jgi:transmembrane sensor
MDLMREERILAEAARWHARLQASDCSENDWVAFERWRAADPLHDQAYAKAERVASSMDRLASDPRLQALTRRALGKSFAATAVGNGGPSSDESGVGNVAPRRRWKIPAALAASAVLALVGLRFAPQLGESPHMLVYDTTPTGRRTVNLEDGSVVQLDVGTSLNVSMSKAARRIELLTGRAQFQVAHDSERPFSVKAGNSRTTALGTVFQVERREQQVIVTLTQGSVAVDDQRPTATWRERLVPGEQLRVDATSAARHRQQVDLQIATSWTRGRHLFRGTPLGEALGEVNRYATKKVRLGDPALADLPVAGNFIAGDSEIIVEALAAVLPLRVVEGSGGEIILFSRYQFDND